MTFRKNLALVMVLAAACAAAQSRKEKREEASERSVQGIVFDSGDKPVEGAVVQLKDMRTLQIRSFVTQPDGTYHFSGLKQDIDYQVKADHDGLSSSPKTVSIFDNRKVAVINLKLEKK